MADDKTTDSLSYDKWIEEALRGVIRQALLSAAEHGLNSNHHFYVTFRTATDGVQLPPHLRAQHPEDMTIVLQHQFWNLEVGEDAFAVTLKFRGKPERLVVPLAAVTAFADPGVNFGLQLKVVSSAVGAGAEQAAAGSEAKEKPPQRETGEVIALDTFRKK